MFGGHIWELVIVLGLALVVFGPKRLPEIGGALGKGIKEFKQGTAGIAEAATATAERGATLQPVPVAASGHDLPADQLRTQGEQASYPHAS